MSSLRPPRIQVLKRRDGDRVQSILGSVAYARRTRAHYGSVVYDFSDRSGDLVAARLYRPAGAPDWTADFRRLWLLADTTETAPDARLCRELVFDLPNGQDEDAMWALTKSFVIEEMVKLGMMADVALHQPAWVGSRTPAHAHVVLSLREWTPSGFGEVRTDWNRDELWPAWKESWAKRCMKPE
jgi:hypothetical protein